ncbi:MAG: LytTR family DNA-binding domain-containing protein [Bacteroidota bacterium]
MIKAIAVDDEPLALKVIEQFCIKVGTIDLIGTFTKSTEAIQFLNEHKIELLFLDINMPSVSGMDLYRSLKHKPKVIFTTAHSEYAVEGFNLDAVDYLLKPFTYKRFTQSVEKYFTIAGEREVNNLDDFVTIRADYSLIKVLFSDILMIESLDNYIKIHLLNEKPLLARITLKNILTLLPADKFIRIHRSYVVPIKNIRTIRNKTLYFLNFELPIGSNYEKEVLDILQKRAI